MVTVHWYRPGNVWTLLQFRDDTTVPVSDTEGLLEASGERIAFDMRLMAGLFKSGTELNATLQTSNDDLLFRSQSQHWDTFHFTNNQYDITINEGDVIRNLSSHVIGNTAPNDINVTGFIPPIALQTGNDYSETRTQSLASRNREFGTFNNVRQEYGVINRTFRNDHGYTDNTLRQFVDFTFNLPDSNVRTGRQSLGTVYVFVHGSESELPDGSSDSTDTLDVCVFKYTFQPSDYLGYDHSTANVKTQTFVHKQISADLNTYVTLGRIEVNPSVQLGIVKVRPTIHLGIIPVREVPTKGVGTDWQSLGCVSVWRVLGPVFVFGPLGVVSVQSTFHLGTIQVHSFFELGRVSVFFPLGVVRPYGGFIPIWIDDHFVGTEVRNPDLLAPPPPPRGLQSPVAKTAVQKLSKIIS